MFLARLSGGGLASFEASRLATGYHNANRFEIHGDRGALRFDFERMNELDFYDATGDGATAGWTTIDVTRGGDGHPYAAAWWPDSHGLGYEHGFVNQAADILTMIGGGEPLVPDARLRRRASNPARARCRDSLGSRARPDRGRRGLTRDDLPSQKETDMTDATIVRTGEHAGRSADRGTSGAHAARSAATPIPISRSRSGCSSRPS